MTKQAIDGLDSQVKESKVRPPRRNSCDENETTDLVNEIQESDIESVEETVIEEEPPNFEKSQEKNIMDMVTRSTQESGTPIRYPASAFFNINSIDRYATALTPTAQFAKILLPVARQTAIPASNFNMSLQRNLLSGYFHRLTVSEVNLQWNIPTINSQNYIFSMTANDSSGNISSSNVVLTFDYYTYTELAAHLETEIRSAFSSKTPNLNALTVQWTTQYSGDGYTFIFNTENDTVIEFNTGLVNSSGAINGNIGQATRAMYKFYNMLGITDALISFPYNILATIPSYPTLIYTSYIDIISNKLSQFMRVKDSETSWSPDTSVITRVYLSNTNGISAPLLSQTGTTTFDTFAIGSRPFVLNYSPNTVKNIKWDPGQSIIDFDIRVVDEFGDLVPWNAKIIQPTDAEEYTTEVFEFQLTVLASET